ncbi:hypothetical protein [Enterococcus sp. HY326]|uniref:hypothetical protein n=1 Tax=Enterococcus sp. HY326 TaxID=2971265 RepID=UPI00223EB2A5|nr:hypothetical protein [Enterococcus sp. HY326]
MKREIKLNPKEFANLVVSSHQSNEENLEKIAKEKLTLYLVSYTLVEEFNKLEKENLYGISNEEFQSRLSNLQFSPNEYFKK